MSTLRVLSLGAGVQSSVLALLLSRGDERLAAVGYRKPDVAIFADTRWEPQYVYDHLNWLQTQLQYEIIRVSDGDIRKNLKEGTTTSGHRFIDVPLFTINPDGKRGMLRRQCTNHYKIKPIYRKVRELAGGVRGRRFPKDRNVLMWIGISKDEVSRMKPSREAWVEHCYPLVDIGLSREDCRRWFEIEYPDRYLPRSACVICPYRSNAHWRELRREEPSSYQEAVQFDHWLRASKGNPIQQLLKGRPYLHSSCRPLEEVIEGEENNVNFFNNECEGMCGV